MAQIDQTHTSIIAGVPAWCILESMLLNRERRVRWVLAALLIGALLSLVALGAGSGGHLDWLLFVPLFWFAFAPSLTRAWRAPLDEGPAQALEPLLGPVASRAPPSR